MLIYDGYNLHIFIIYKKLALSTMLDILLNWNRWGTNPLHPGHRRTVLDKLCKLISAPEIIVLTGMRRSGKSTILYQMMSFLEEQNIPKEAMLYVNFEDPGFSNHLTPQLLDKIYRVYREEVFPEGKAYIFLDEIQVVPEWERWVSTRNETENIKIWVSGSSAKLMSRELATLLTGRHFAIPVYPLSFSEYLRFLSIDAPSRPLPYQAPPKIQAALNQYLSWGGLPRVAISQDDFEKRTLLQSYLNDILFKDIALRHNIRQINLLRDLAVYLFTQTSCLISYKRLANIYNVSQDIIHAYCDYIEEAFLVHFIPICSLKMADQQRNPKKLHVHDLGFRHIANLSALYEKGKLIETAVYHALNQQENDGIFYWKKTHEVDFVVRRGVDFDQFIQVTHSIENKDTLQREINALIEAHQYYPQAKKIFIVEQWGNFSDEIPDFIQVMPLWRFLI